MTEQQRIDKQVEKGNLEKVADYRGWARYCSVNDEVQSVAFNGWDVIEDFDFDTLVDHIDNISGSSGE